MCDCDRAHEAAALVIHTTEEECDNICRLSTHFLSRVLTDWQAALLFAKSHPYSPHIMVRHVAFRIMECDLITSLHCYAGPC